SPPCAPLIRPPPSTALCPYTTLFRSHHKKPPTSAGWHPRSRTRKFLRLWRRRPTCREYPIRARPVLRQVDRASSALASDRGSRRSEEHTSELQSRENLVCRLLLAKKH